MIKPPRHKKLAGTFGSLTVLGYDRPARVGNSPNPKAFWKVRCVCGTELSVTAQSLTTGHSTSCGCLKNRTHGHSVNARMTPEMHTYHSAKYNCESHSKENYAARGIKFLFTSLEEFLATLGPKPEQSYLCRHDKNGDFSAENCYWRIYKRPRVPRLNEIPKTLAA